MASSAFPNLFSLLPEAIQQQCCCKQSSVLVCAVELDLDNEKNPACEDSVSVLRGKAGDARRYPCLLSQHAILKHDPTDTEKQLFPNDSMPPEGSILSGRLSLGSGRLSEKNASIDFGMDSDNDEVQPGEERPSRTEAVPGNGESPCFQLTFVLNGEEKSVLILRRALGLQIGKTASRPCKVKAVHPESYACELGIEVGWILKEIDGEDVSNKPLEEVQEMMKKGLMTLPQ